MKVSFVDIGVENSGVLVSFFSEDEGLLIDEKSQNDKEIKKLYEKLRKSSKKNKIEQNIVDLVHPHNNEFSRIILFKIKDLSSMDEGSWINQGGKICQYICSSKITEFSIRIETTKKNIELMSIPARLAFGIGLKSYKFEKYKSKNKGNVIHKVLFITSHHTTSENIHKNYNAILDGVNLTRDLVNEPSNILTPHEYTKRIGDLAGPDLKIKILNQKKMDQLSMGALLAVAKGSRNEPYTVILEYLPNKGQKPLVVLGKGVTFDSGGISIKPSGGMDEMKGDMAGSASVIGLMSALSKRKANANVVGIVGLVENMTDGNAMRPGDVIKSMSGKTIEVLNTDAEGRLVLADIATYAIQNYKPSAIIDLATLTGAILVALGQEMAGLFCNNDELADNLINSGKKTGELLWRMPIDEKYMKMINSKVADIKNIGGRYAGAITAAEFIHYFVEDIPWAHLDIAGTAITSPKSDVNDSWASGYGVRLLNQYIRDCIEN